MKQRHNRNRQLKLETNIEFQALDLKGIALITIWWYNAASAAPMKGPTQKIHCIHKEKKRSPLVITYKCEVRSIVVALIKLPPTPTKLKCVQDFPYYFVFPSEWKDVCWSRFCRVKHLRVRRRSEKLSLKVWPWQEPNPWPYIEPTFVGSMLTFMAHWDDMMSVVTNER